MQTPFFSFSVQIVYINIDWTRRRKSVPTVLTETVVCLPRNHICLVTPRFSQRTVLLIFELRSSFQLFYKPTEMTNRLSVN